MQTLGLGEWVGGWLFGVVGTEGW